MRQHLGDLSEYRIYTSNIARAIETAEIATGVPGESFVRDCGLCETHPGENDGCSWGDLGRYQGIGFEVPIGPGGESIAGMYERVDRFLGELAFLHSADGKPGKGILAFTHAGVIGSAYALARGLSVSTIFEVPIELCSVHRLEVEGDPLRASGDLRTQSATIDRAW